MKIWVLLPVVVVLAAGAYLLTQDGEDAKVKQSRVAGRNAPLAREASFRLEVVARGLVRPTSVTAAPGDADALWVTEQTGRLIRLQGDTRSTVLDLRKQVSVGGERGLLGLAFHPGFTDNRRFFVNYTDRRGDTRVVEYTLGRDGRADVGTRREILRVEQPEENHNGGSLVFAGDGRLLVGMGDGGGAFDPQSRAQNPGDRLGKILAGDVDAGNPVRWAVVVTGARNPWRMWMDPALDELWIGDVGQDKVEEIDRIRYEPDEPAKNLGWPAFEGDKLLDADRLKAGGELVAPVAVYGHNEGCSVTGGLIYRGRRVDALRDRYVYGDFCTGAIWTLQPRPGLRVADIRREREQVPQLTSIGADSGGELVFAAASGQILRAVPSADYLSAVVDSARRLTRLERSGAPRSEIRRAVGRLQDALERVPDR